MHIRTHTHTLSSSVSVSDRRTFWAPILRLIEPDIDTRVHTYTNTYIYKLHIYYIWGYIAFWLPANTSLFKFSYQQSFVVYLARYKFGVFYVTYKQVCIWEVYRLDTQWRRRKQDYGCSDGRTPICLSKIWAKGHSTRVSGVRIVHQRRVTIIYQLKGPDIRLESFRKDGLSKWPVHNCPFTFKHTYTHKHILFLYT